MTRVIRAIMLVLLVPLLAAPSCEECRRACEADKTSAKCVSCQGEGARVRGYKERH